MQISRPNKFGKLYWYPTGAVMIMVVFLLSLMVAKVRVSRSEAYPGQPLNSFDCHNQPLDERQVISIRDCG